jgi:hypothetical protein
MVVIFNAFPFILVVCVCELLSRIYVEWKRKLCFRHLRDICICFSSRPYFFLSSRYSYPMLHETQLMKWQNMKKLFCVWCVRSLMQIKRNHMLRINWNWQKFDTRSCGSLHRHVCVYKDFRLICMQSTYVKLSHINNVNIQ